MQINPEAVCDFKRFAEEAAGHFQLVLAQSQIETSSDQHGGMISNADRDVEPLAARTGGARHHREVMVGGNADHGAVAVERLYPRKRKVGATAHTVFGDDRPGGHIRSGLVFEEFRDRQFFDEPRLGNDVLLAEGGDATVRWLSGLSMAAMIVDCTVAGVAPMAVAMRGSEFRRFPTTGMAWPATLSKRSAGPRSASARQAAMS